MRLNTVLILVAIILLLGSGIIIRKQHIALKETTNLYKVTQDSLKLTRNELNQQKATIEVLQSEKTSLFTELSSKDASISRLQKIIKQYEKEFGDLNTAIIISNETIIKLKDSIKAIIIGYTSVINDTLNTIVSYPVYEHKFKTDWNSGTVIASIDSLDLSIRIKNEYDITIGDERAGWFKKKRYANITNLNPDTETKVMKVYQKEEVKTKSPRTFIAGGIVGALIVLLL